MRGLATGALVVLLCATALHPQTELISYQNYGSFSAFSGKVQALAYSYQGNLLAVGGVAGNVVLYDVAGRRVLASLAHGGRSVRGLVFRRDDSYLAAATDARAVVVWDLKTLRPKQFIGHSGPVLTVAFGIGGDLLASAGTDKEIILWSLNLGIEVGRLRGGHTKDISFLTFVGRDETLVSVGKDRQIIYWDVKAKTKLRQLLEPDAYIPSATVSPGGELLILGTEQIMTDPGFRGCGGQQRTGACYQDRIKLYNVQTGSAEKVIENLPVEPTSVSLSADYAYVAVAQRDVRRSTVGIWDVQRAVQVAQWPVSTKISALAFSPDGKFFAYGDEAGGVQVLEIKGVIPRPTLTADLRGRKYVITSPRDPLVKPTSRLHFAMLELDNLGVEADVSRAVTDQLNNRLAANPAVQLVERRRIQALLREQEFQHSGRTDPDAAVRLARVLNVQKLIIGSVAKLGTTLTISVSLVHVETARIEGIREIQCRSCALEDLSEAVSDLSDTVVAPPAAPGTSAQAPETGVPPTIDLTFPPDGYQAASETLTIRGVAQAQQGLRGIELVMNGQPLAASREVSLARGTVTTPIAAGTTEFRIEQEVRLVPGNNIIVLRAIGTDGADLQRYVFVRRETAVVGVMSIRKPAFAKRWAVIVGISLYKDPNIPALKYADRDAEALAAFVQTPEGGSYPKENILLLANEQATTGNLSRALRGFLQKPDTDDFVLIYLASHGLPDPNRPENVYFLSHDTDLNDVAGSALPMREIEQTIKHTLLAQRVVILSDACHSGAVGMMGARRATVDPAEEINRSFQQALVNTQPGIAVFTSALARETSLEGPQWGGGHGVFTWYLLEGMRGKADKDSDGTVTVDELFDFVRENVKRETENRQHPQIISGNYDPALPMSILVPKKPQ